MELLQIVCILTLPGNGLLKDIIHKQRNGRQFDDLDPITWIRKADQDTDPGLSGLVVKEGYTIDKNTLPDQIHSSSDLVSSKNFLAGGSDVSDGMQRVARHYDNGTKLGIGQDNPTGRSTSYVGDTDAMVKVSVSNTIQLNDTRLKRDLTREKPKVMRSTGEDSGMSESWKYETASQQLTGESKTSDKHPSSTKTGNQQSAFNGRAADQLHNLRDYEITVPIHVDYKGTFLGYVQDTKTHRMKRNINSAAATSSNSLHQSAQDKANVYYKLWVFDRYLFLNLTVNNKFLSRSYQVERWTGSDIIKSQGNRERCYWQGHVISEATTSNVVISDCNGLRGTFNSQGQSYFIEPLQSGGSTSITGQQHIVYQKEAIRNIAQNNTKCGQPASKVRKHSSTSPDDIHQDNYFNDVLKPRLRHHRMKKYKREQKGSRGKRSVSAGQRSRGRRSVSVEKYVETLVVVDKMMVDYHGKEEIEPFVLAVMNVVAKLYHEASIGNSINIVVTRLVLLLEDQEDLKLSFHAEDSLQSFCKWQEKINPAENSHDVLHNGIANHDNAILLTRYDICSHRDEPCGTLGLAPVAGMCESDRSCSIVEDIGLATAFTVAHEMGHNFGMQHDGAGNNCGLPGGEAAKLMASQLTSKTNPFQWSTCSKDYITSFLDSGRGQCLNNPPPDMEFDYLDEMPGQNHSPDTQCKWQYGPKSVMCKPQLMCRELYCINPAGDCITNSIPAAEGTPCSSSGIEEGVGETQWCSEGQCQERGDIAKPVDGEWSEWSPWADCSRTCGGGVASSERHCNKPRPKHGGRFCIGERKRYRSCNIEDCESGSKDFREIQCSYYDSILFRGKYYTWKPFAGATHSKPCALNCLAEGYNFYTERAPKVVDGTRCYPDVLDVCVNGECLSVGCDKILGSEAVEDKCRVCDGDGSSCTTVKGFFNKPLENMTDTYKEILRIPKGALNIDIRESTVSRNYIAIKTTRDDHYYINGHWTIDWSRKVKVADTVFYYKRPKGKIESVFALGPISEDITALLLLQEDNLGIEYEYNLPIALEEEEEHLSLKDDDFGWKYLPWSECSATCSTGEMLSEVQCVRQSDGRPVEDVYCDQIARPQDQRKSCYTASCAPLWYTGKWSPCSKSCGSGTKTRKVTCVQTTDTQETVVLDHSQCQGKKPRNKARCQNDWCPPRWQTGDWSQCSPLCGRGTQARAVYCVTTEGKHVTEYKCEKEERPQQRRHCRSQECVRASWVYGDWEECTAQCGQGLQKRDITCEAEDGSESSYCKSSDKPESVRTCTGPCKPKTEEECIDVHKVTYCPLVVQFQFCNRAYFHHMCCRTCRNAGFHQGYQP